jgi:hypothetical protein
VSGRHFALGLMWGVGIGAASMVYVDHLERTAGYEKPGHTRDASRAPVFTARKEDSMSTSHRLKADAANRSVRVFLQGLGFAVLAAIVMVLYPVFSGAHSWGDLDWSLIGFALIQAAGTSALAYFMRTVLDPSGFPTPLPPADPGEPDAAAGA